MTATAADALRMLAPDTPEQWPAGILAAADVRQARAEAATPGPWRVAEEVDGVYAGRPTVVRVGMGIRIVSVGQTRRHDGSHADANVEHLAAEANPAHALAAVRHWRGTVDRHMEDSSNPGRCYWCDYAPDPCPDLTEVADEARAYVGGIT